MAPADKALRDQLISLLGGGNAHASFEQAVAGIPEELQGSKPPGAPHSPWQILEHLRIAQWDIFEFSRHAKHVSPDWPAGYWPSSEAPPNQKFWSQSVAGFRCDLKGMKELVGNPSTNLNARIPWGDGQTVLREALVLADHNSYHIGQLILVRRLLGAWKED